VVDRQVLRVSEAVVVLPVGLAAEEEEPEAEADMLGTHPVAHLVSGLDYCSLVMGTHLPRLNSAVLGTDQAEQVAVVAVVARLVGNRHRVDSPSWLDPGTEAGNPEGHGKDTRHSWGVAALGNSVLGNLHEGFVVGNVVGLRIRHCHSGGNSVRVAAGDYSSDLSSLPMLPVLLDDNHHRIG
jgi:hypothetical protein